MATHTPGAIRAAEAIFDGVYGDHKKYRTAYGGKSIEGVADIIDRETHAPELAEALRNMVAWHSDPNASDDCILAATDLLSRLDSK